MGSPPPAGSKNEVFRLRSVRSIVMAPARTGRANRRRIVVRNTDQTNRGVKSQERELDRILIMVEIKLMAPRIEEAPARCRLKIDRSTEAPEWAMLAARGG